MRIFTKLSKTFPIKEAFFITSLMNGNSFTQDNLGFFLFCCEGSELFPLSVARDFNQFEKLALRYVRGVFEKNRFDLGSFRVLSIFLVFHKALCYRERKKRGKCFIRSTI